MSFLNDLLGDDRKQQDYQDFIGRYEDGPPHEGFSDNEALERHEEVASQLSPEEYQEAARGAFERMSPGERTELARHLQEHGREQGLDLPAGDGDAGSPDLLAKLVGGLHQQGGAGLLGQVLGGGLGGGGGVGRGGGAAGMLGNPLAKAALGGIAAMAAKRFLRR